MPKNRKDGRKKTDKGVFVQTRVPTPVVEYLRKRIKRDQISLSSHLRRLIYSELEKQPEAQEVLKEIGWLA